MKDPKDAVRTNLAGLVRRFGQEFPGGRPVLTWLVKYSVAMVNKCRRDSAAQGAQVRASTAAFCGEDPLHDPWSHEKGGESRTKMGGWNLPWCV